MTFPKPADPRATAANVPTTAITTPAVSRRPCFLFILCMTFLAFLSLASLLLRRRDRLDDGEESSATAPRARLPYSTVDDVCLQPPARRALCTYGLLRIF